MKKEIKKSWYFDQPPQTVWEYLTKPELLEQWLMPNDFKPIVGHKFSFVAQHAKDGINIVVHHHCEVLELVPCKKLTYLWRRDDMSINSKVLWTLIPRGNGTELQLVHNGFVETDAFASHNNGWPMVVSRLVEQFNLL